MKFVTETQARCHAAMALHLREAFGAAVQQDPELPTFRVWRGSAMVEARVEAWRGDMCRVIVRAVVVSGARISSGLLSFLLEQNARMDLGAFGVGDQDEVVFQHAYVTAQPEPAALTAAVHAVLGTADAFDDRIRDKWGGMRAVDRGQAQRRPLPARAVSARSADAVGKTTGSAPRTVLPPRHVAKVDSGAVFHDRTETGVPAMEDEK